MYGAAGQRPAVLVVLFGGFTRIRGAIRSTSTGGGELMAFGLRLGVAGLALEVRDAMNEP